MERTNPDIINAAQHLLYIIHMGQNKKIRNLCTQNILWKYNHDCSQGILSDKIYDKRKSIDKAIGNKNE